MTDTSLEGSSLPALIVAARAQPLITDNEGQSLVGGTAIVAAAAYFRPGVSIIRDANHRDRLLLTSAKASAGLALMIEPAKAHGLGASLRHAPPAALKQQPANPDEEQLFGDDFDRNGQEHAPDGPQHGSDDLSRGEAGVPPAGGGPPVSGPSGSWEEEDKLNLALLNVLRKHSIDILAELEQLGDQDIEECRLPEETVSLLATRLMEANNQPRSATAGQATSISHLLPYCRNTRAVEAVLVAFAQLVFGSAARYFSSNIFLLTDCLSDLPPGPGLEALLSALADKTERMLGDVEARFNIFELHPASGIFRICGRVMG